MARRNRDEEIVKLRRTLVALVTAATIPLGATLVACGNNPEDEYATTTVAEDCDVEDQANREDDCGYWTKNGENRVGARPNVTWLWVWYAWVVTGRTSAPPAGWTAPRGVKFPTKTVRVNRKNCALGVLAPVAPRPAQPAPQPARPGGNVNRPPANVPPANAPQNNAPQRPVYKPPAGQKVSC
jgi:hypothetical protein